MKTCSRCGAENPDARTACVECFAPLDRRFAAQKNEARPGKEAASLGPALRAAEPRRRSPLLVVAPLVLLCLAVGGGAWYFLLRPTPEKAYRAYLDLATTNPDAAYDLLTADSQQLIPRNFMSKATRFPQFLPKASDVKITGVTNEGDTAEIDTSVTPPTPPPGAPTVAAQLGPIPQTVYMAQEDGQWKVDLKRSLSEQFAKLPAPLRSQAAMSLRLAGPQFSALADLMEGGATGGSGAAPGRKQMRKRHRPAPNAKARHLPTGGAARG